MSDPDNRIPVGILGATGMVGQRLVEALRDHPWFRVAELAASERSAGRRYEEAATWRLPGDIPSEVADLQVQHVQEPLNSPLLFSGLGSEIAGDLEPALAKQGKVVVSNASSHRMASDVPLLIPEVNPEHLDLLKVQRARRGGTGLLVTNPNCSTIGLTIALAPVERAFGLEQVAVVTLQALSGAGFPGVPSLSVADNVVPWISGEAEKIAEEPRKILGRLEADAIHPSEFTVSAKVHRVPVSDGHTMTVLLRTRDSTATSKGIADAMRQFRGAPQMLELPSAPERPIHVLEAPDRPQPALDRNRERGMAVSVGGLETCPVLGFKFEALVHNTIRGAAGAAVLNAELLKARGWLDGLAP